MPSDLIPDAVLDDRDVRAAQAVLDAWLEDPERGPMLATRDQDQLLVLRGILAVQLADVRAAGVLEGYEAGRHRGHAEARQAALEALEVLP